MSTPLARSSDPVTSDLAAESLTNRAEIEAFVFMLFRLNGDMTDHELTDAYFQHESAPLADLDSPRKRRSEPTTAGLLTKVEGVRRAGGSGRSQQVWKVTT
jgi:hypothetical protein